MSGKGSVNRFTHKVSLAHNVSFWGQKLNHNVSFWPQKYCWPIFTISGPRNRDLLSVSGARNRENGSAWFLAPETDIMGQFMGPETDIMGESYFMFYLQRQRDMCATRLDQQLPGVLRSFWNESCPAVLKEQKRILLYTDIFFIF